MDLRVHEYASGVADAQPYPRSDVPYANNGSSDKAFKPQATALLQREYSDEVYPIEQGRKDISEKGIDENVHWFANPNTETLNWERSKEPFAYNGSGPKAFKPSLYQRRQDDISEKGIDENVHWLSQWSMAAFTEGNRY